MKISSILYIIYLILVIFFMMFVLKTYTAFIIVNSLIVISMLLWQWRDTVEFITNIISNVLDYYENKDSYV